MSIRCANCDSEISAAARICPHCRTNPYDYFATPDGRTVENVSMGGPRRIVVDPLTVGVLGTLMLPVLPIAGAALVGFGVLAKVMNRRNE